MLPSLLVIKIDFGEGKPPRFLRLLLGENLGKDLLRF
jgi:hypothetical protein